MNPDRPERKRKKLSRNVIREAANARLDVPVPALKPLAYYIRRAIFPTSLLLTASTAFAGPDGGEVVAGSADISRPDINTTVINQQSTNVAIDWTNFNINYNELVQFNQPSTTAAALNRIYDQNPTQIYGSLRANGQVVLLNPNGVFFSPTARVNVGSLIASSLDLKTQDFMSGNYSFKAPVDAEGGLIVNQGILEAANGGSINLVGGAVRNEGLILATAGQVNLVAGKKVTMDFDGDGLIQFAVDESVLQNAYNLDAAVSNTGEISADGGSVLLTGSAAKDVFSNVVNNEGVIKAGRIENHGGKITLVAGGTSNSLINTGTLNVSGQGGDGGTIKLQSTGTTLVSGESVITAASEDGKGGAVQILGDKVGLLDIAAIDASGLTGGGTVLIGGDYQGSNTDVQNATATYVGKDTSIKADAIENGDGGKVIVWADNTTRYYGDVSAQGGDNSGDGGFVEVSGKGFLDFNGTVNTLAEHGQTGTLLLDPTNIYIALDQTNATTAGMSGTDTSIDISGPPLFEASGSVNDSLLTTGALLSALGTTNVTVSTTNASGGGVGDITIVDDITYTGITDRTLTFLAENSIRVLANANITSTMAKLDVTLNSDSDNSGAGAIVMNSGSSIVSNGGDIVLGGGLDPLSDSAVGTAANPFGIFISGATLNSAGGNISLLGQGLVTTAGAADTAGIVIRSKASAAALVSSGSGNIIINGTGGAGTTTIAGVWIDGFESSTVSTGTVSSSGGNITIEGTGGTTSGGGVFISNGGHVTVSGADGDISITGSTTNGVGRGGVEISAGCAICVNPTFVRNTATNGNIEIEGINTVVTADVENNGVVLRYAGSYVEATGGGTLKITGTGGEGGSGIQVRSARVTSSTGDITLIGTGTSGVGNSGLSLDTESAASPGIGIIESTGGDIFITATAAVGGTGIISKNTEANGKINRIGKSTMTGDITLTTDTIDIATTMTITGQGKLFIQPKNAGTTIGLTDFAAGILNLTTAELGKIQNGFSLITIGRADAGAITFGNAGSGHSFSDSIKLLTGGSILLAGPLAVGTAGDSITLVAGAAIVDANPTGAALIGDVLSLTAGTDIGFGVPLEVAGVEKLSIDVGGSFDIASTDAAVLTDLSVSVNPGAAGTYELDAFAGLTFNMVSNAGDVLVNDIMSTTELNLEVESKTGDIRLADTAIDLGADGGNVTLIVDEDNSILDHTTPGTEDTAGSDFNIKTKDGFTVTLKAPGGSVGAAGTSGDIDISGASNYVVTAAASYIESDAIIDSLDLTFDPLNDDILFNLVSGTLTVSIDELGGDVRINTVNNSDNDFDFSLTSTSGILIDNIFGIGDGNVLLTALNGSINELNNNGVAKITTGGSITLSATTGIGTLSALDIADVTGGDGVSLNLSNTVSGNLNVRSIGDLTITGFQNDGTGTTRITTASALTQGVDLIQAGDIILTAGEDTGTPGAGDNLTIASGITVRSTGNGVGQGNVTLRAGDNVTLEANAVVESTSSDTDSVVLISAGFDGTTADNDNIGTIQLDADAVVTNNNGTQADAVTLRGLDIVLDGTSAVSALAVNGAITITALTGNTGTGNVGLGTGTGQLSLDDTELGTLGADRLLIQSPGTISVEDVTAANTAGIAVTTTLDTTGSGNIAFLAGVVGTVFDNNLVVDSGGQITFADGSTLESFSGNLTLTAAASGVDAIDAAGIVGLSAGGDVTINSNMTAAGDVSIIADADTNDSGTFTIASGATLNTADNMLLIFADDVDIAGNLNSGAGVITIGENNNDGIGLGTAIVAGGLNISVAELQQISSDGGLILDTPGNIIVDSIATSDSANIVGIALLSGLDVKFEGDAVFNSLMTQAGGNILVGQNVAIETVAGDIILFSDFSSADGGAIFLDDGASLTSNGFDIILDGVGDATYAAGITLINASIDAGGGNIFMFGSGSATGGDAIGIDIDGGSSVVTDTAGIVEIIGIGGGDSGSNNLGVRIADATVSAFSINVNGTAGSGSVGIGIFDAAQLTGDGAGNITLIGTGADGQAGIASSSSGGNNLIGGSNYGGAITLSATNTDGLGDSIVLDDLDIQGDSNLFLHGNAADTIGIGAGTGLFNLSATDLAAIRDGFDQITIGGISSAIITIDTATFLDRVLFISDVGVINVTGPLTGAVDSDAAFAFATDGTVTLSGDISTDGGDVDFSGAEDIRLGADVSIDTENGGADQQAGSVFFAAAGSIDSNTDGEFGLTIDVTGTDDNDGNVDLGNVGATTALGHLTVTANTGTITLNGGLIRTSVGVGTGDITFGSTVVLTADTQIFTGGGDYNAANAVHTSDGLGLWDLSIDTFSGTGAGDVYLADFDDSGGSFVNTVTLLMDDAPDGTLHLSGDILLDHDGTEAADFSFTGGDIVLDDSASIVTVQTAGAHAGSIDLGTSIISASAPGFDLTLNTSATGVGNAGNVTIGEVSNAAATDFIRNLNIFGSGTASASVMLGGAVETGGFILIDGANDVDIDFAVTAGTNLTIQNVAAAIDLAGGIALTALDGNLDLNNSVGTINLSGVGTNTLTALDGDDSGDDGNVELGDISDSAEANLSVIAEGSVTLLSIVLDHGGVGGGMGNLNVEVDSDDDTAGATLTVGGVIDVDGSVSLSGDSGTFDDIIDVLADITAGTSLSIANAAVVRIDAGSARTLTTEDGDLDVSSDVGGILLVNGDSLVILDANDAGSGSGSVNIAALDTDGSGASLTITADAGVEIGNINLGGTSIDGNLSITVDEDDNTEETLVIGGGITNVSAVSFFGGADGDDTLDIDMSVTAETTLTVEDFLVVNLAESVNLTTLDGALTISTNVGSINLSGASGTTNIIDGNGDALVSLANLTDDDDANLTVNSEGGITLAGSDLGSGTLLFNVDNDDDVTGTETLTVNDADIFTGGIITFRGGTGTNDTIDINADVSAAASLTIRNAGSVLIDASAVRTLTAADGNLDISTSVTGITLDGGSELVTLIAGTGATVDGDVLLAAINTNPGAGDGASLAVQADGHISFSSIDLDGQTGGDTDGTLSMTVDFDDDSSGILTVGGGVTNVAAITLSGGGTGTDDTIDINADLTTTAGDLIVENADDVLIDASTLRVLTANNGDLFISNNIGQITLDGGDNLVTINAFGTGASADADVTLSDIVADNGGATSADLTVNADGSIDLGSVLLDATADGTLIVEADFDDDTTELLSIAGVVTAAEITLTANSDGDITIVDLGAAPNQDVTATAGNLTVNAGGTLTLEDSAAPDSRTRLVTTGSAPNNDIFINVGTALVIQDNDTANAAQIMTAGDLTINPGAGNTIGLGDDAVGFSDFDMDDAALNSLTSTGGGILTIGGTGSGRILLDMILAFTSFDGNLTLSTAEYITDNSASNAFTSGGTLTLTSGAGAVDGTIGTDDTLGNNTDGTLGIDVETLVVTSTGGFDVNVTDSGANGDTTFDIATGGAGTVTVVQTTNDLVVDSISTTGDVDLTATAGSITDGNGAANNVTAQVLTSNAEGGIDLDTTVVSLNASVSGAGNINIDESDGITLMDVDTANGSITITAGGLLTATDVVSLTDNDANDISLTGVGIAVGVVNAGATAGDVVLNAGTGAITDGNGGTNNVTAEVLTADAEDGIDLDTTVVSLNASVSGAGNIDINESDGITLTDVDTANGSITIVSGGAMVASDVQSSTDNDANDISLTATTGDLTVGTVTVGAGGVDATAGDVSLTATAGSIIDNANDATTDITGEVVTLTAATGVGQTGGNGSLDTRAVSLDVSVTGAGIINIAELNGVTLTAIDTDDGSITITAGGLLTATDVESLTDDDANDISLTGVGIVIGVVNAGTTAGDVTLNAGTGGITDGNAGANNVTAEVLTADAEDGIDLDTTVVSLNASVSGAGNIDINESDGITLLDVDTANGSITIVSGGAMVATDVQSSTDNDANDISLTATTGDLTVGTVTVGAGGVDAAAGDVTLMATAGSIIDNANDGTTDITGEVVTLTAGTGVGETAGNGSLDTRAVSLDVSVTGAGIINIAELNGVTLAAVDTDDGSITITTGGATTITNVQSGTNGAVSVTASTGDVEVDTFSSGTGTGTIEATTGAITDTNDNSTVTAGALTLTAATGIGAGGGLDINTMVTSLDASVTGPGNLFVNETDGITLLDVDTANGSITIVSGGAMVATDVQSSTDADANDISLTATTGNLTVGTVTVGVGGVDATLGDVSLTATAGAIVDDADDATPDVTGEVVTLTAATGVGQTAGTGSLDTRAVSLDVSVTGAGLINIAELNGVTLTAVDTTDGSITIVSGGAMVVTEVQSSTDNDANDISLTATTGDLTVGTVTVGAGGVDATAGDVTLTATAGSIIDNANDATTDITGEVVTLTAAAGVGQTAGTGSLDTRAVSLDVSVMGAGLINIAELNGVTLTDVDTANGSITITTGGATTIADVQSGTNGAVSITASTGNVEVDTFSSGTGTGTIVATAGAITDTDNNSTVTAGALTLTAATGIGSGGGLAINTTVASLDGSVTGTGDLFVDETDAITLTAVDTADGAITVTAGGLMTVTNVTSTIDDDANDISLTGVGIAVGTITAGAGVNADVTLEAGTGAITDGNGATNNITAQVLTLDADAGINLDTVASSFDVDNTTSGNIDIDNSTTVLATITGMANAAAGGTISFDQIGGGSLSITGGVSSSNGTITITSANNMTLGAVTVDANGGAINLRVDEANAVAATLDLGGSTLDGSDINLDGGTAGGNDILIGQNLANTWTVNGVNSGTFDNTGILTAASADFTNFQVLQGNTNTDSFVIANGGSITTVDGQGGTDTLDYSTRTGPVSVTLTALGGTDGFAGNGTGVTGFDDIDSLVGSSAADTLTGINAAAAWTVDGTNTYVASARTLNFSAVENLTGNADVDTFTVSVNHTGNLSGLAGNDVFNLREDAIVTGNLLGGAGEDLFDFNAAGDTDRTAHVVGNVDGGASTGFNDTIDFSNSLLVVGVSIAGAGTLHGSAGTILDAASSNPPDFNLISGTYDNIDDLFGNGGLIIGPNANTWWNITDVDEGFFGASRAAINTTAFDNFQILAGNQQDTFVFQNGGQITGGIDGGGGTNILAGSLGADTFNITDGSATGNDSVNIVVGALTTSLTNISRIDGTDATDDGITTVGDTGADTFNINFNWAGALAGTGGIDTFVFADTRTVGGTLDGGAGADIINWNAYTTGRIVTITLSDATGFDGTQTSITGGFTNVEDIRGSTTATTDELQGENQINTFALTALNTGTLTQGTDQLTFSAFKNLTGGTSNDIFDFNGGSVTGIVDGGNGGVNTLDYAGAGAAITVTIDDLGTNVGFTGTASSTGGFDNITALIGSGNAADELIGDNTTSQWTISGADDGSYVSTRTLSFMNIANLTGGSQVDTFTLSGGTLSGAIDGGAGSDELIGSTTYVVNGANDGTATGVTGGFVDVENLTGTTGTDTFTFEAGGSLDGLASGLGGTDTFDFNGGIANQIDGGAGSDTLNLADAGGASTITLAGSVADGFSGTSNVGVVSDFADIDTIVGSAGTDTVIGYNAAGTAVWTVATGNDTYVADAHTLTLTAYENFTGNAGVDTFNITGTHTGNLAGAAGNDTFNLGASGDLTGSVAGDGDTDTLTGGDDYLINGANSGTVTGISAGWGTIENLTGTAGADTFTFAGGGSLSGTASGLGDNDTFDFNGGTANIVSGGTGTDTLDLAGAAVATITLTNTGTNDGFTGTSTVGVTGSFDDINTLIGSAGTDTLIGRNAAASWNIQAGNDTYVSTNTLTFSAIENLTGNGGIDTFNVTGAHTGNLSGQGGNDVFNFSAALTGTVSGDANDDTFNLLAGGSVSGTVAGGTETDTLTGGNNYNVTGANSGSVTGTGGWNTIENLTGTAGVDTFTFSAGGSLSGMANGLGDNDLFDFNGGTVGIVDGQAGNDTLDFAGAGSVTISLENIGTVDGFTGTSTNIGNIFDNIDNVVGSAGIDTLIGNVIAGGAFTVQAGNDTYVSTNTLIFNAIENLTSGAGDDTFTINAVHAGNIDTGEGNNTVDINSALTGNITGGTGNDTLNAVATITGNITDAGGTNTLDLVSVNGNITTAAGNDTIVTSSTINGDISDTGGTNVLTSTGLINGNVSFGAGNDTLTISNTVSGALSDSGGNNTITLGADIAGGVTSDGNNTINLNTNFTTGITTGNGNDSINFNAGTLSGDLSLGAGNNIYNFGGGNATGTVTITGTDTWNHAAGVKLGSSIIGTGSVAVADPNKGDLIVGPADLNLPTLTSFTGHLIIGGTIVPSALPFDGDETITINTDNLTVSSSILSSGDITLLGSNITIEQNVVVSAGGVGGNGGTDQVTLIAIGAANGGTGPGDITGVAFPGTIEGASALLIAANDLISPQNLVIDLDGGEIQIVLGSGNTPTFGILNATPIDATPATTAFLNALAAGTGLNLSNLTFVQAQTLVLGNLIGLEQIAFIDVGLFEEDLTLFGTIGRGIALSLAQCEEVEGCAPDVTEGELDELIVQLEGRITEIERRLAEASPGERAQLETLLAGYRAELNNFTSYKAELQEFYTAEEDFEDDGFGSEFGDESGDSSTVEIQRLTGILETIQSRIQWLENLKSDADNRTRLSESTGIDLTVETIDQIIEATRQQILFIEKQIQQVLQGTQASTDKPIFTAESGDISRTITHDFASQLYSYDRLALNLGNNWY